MLIKRAKPDAYLKKFIEYYKEKYKDNLSAIIIYGSYAWGYFDSKKSDYDLIVLFKEELPTTKEKAEKEIRKKFPKVSLQYFKTWEEMTNYAHLGHFTSYITLLKSGKVLYAKKDYKKFLKKLRKINLFEKAFDIAAIEGKTLFEINVIKKNKKYKAAKYSLPAIRKRLQLLTFIRTKKLIWNLNRNLRKNKNILAKEERDFIKLLNKRVKSRSDTFTKKDRERSIKLIHKINKEIMLNLKNSIK
ncbi:MAG: hypothetical protein A3B89_02995 [Candidatus Buchananbacteria bacterium RIFCSPHIGHO2_02_FULL_40_13]|nr:MAG: hypothetical protein A3B89_02995 [Candidatus Buchananbacteria bacterium RIFCSPHIGHO2_02_FULL_40_13]